MFDRMVESVETSMGAMSVVDRNHKLVDQIYDAYLDRLSPEAGRLARRIPMRNTWTGIINALTIGLPSGRIAILTVKVPDGSLVASAVHFSGF